MCRICAAVFQADNVAPLLHAGLKRLEYGGYDSAGIATLHGGKLYIKKDKGKIDEIHQALNLDDLPGSIGIAHTRWATHGAPSKVNAHPHTDCKGEIAVVHNGIIENFLELKQELENLRHVFISRTDTEVIPHLIEEYYKRTNNFREACFQALRRLQGTFAIAILSRYAKDMIVVARKGSPLLLGIGNGFNFAASDAIAFLDKTKTSIPLEDGDIAFLSSSSYEIYRIEDATPVKRKTITIDWDLQQASKEGYEHFMLKEIMEQPYTMRLSLGAQKQYVDLLAEFMEKSSKNFLVAAGTSYHSCVAASYLYSRLANLATIPVIASEFIEQYGNAIDVNTTILFVSQSGETYDVINAADFARKKACTVLGICNVIGSTLTRMVRAYVHQQSGPEIGVAATKTYTSQLIIHLLLSISLAKKRGKISQSEMDDIKETINELPSLAEQILISKQKEMLEVSKLIMNKNHVFFLARGMNYATALEGRLKLLEIAYIPSTAYPAGESKHGPISLIEEGVPVIFIAPNDETRKLLIGNIMEMKARKATIITLGEEGDSELMQLSDHYIAMPRMLPIITPILYIMPLQLLAYYTAVNKGLDPDKPRNLAKSVTVL
ncbi:MAG TPA: glutamine--fructose-6-phosphate transaminase (isomerizing) [Geobacterales bacterium]|nr:glutamine--fructose-6-phosphate transaminase (isomerizing) [Geobacterales bacterium]